MSAKFFDIMSVVRCAGRKKSRGRRRRSGEKGCEATEVGVSLQKCHSIKAQSIPYQTPFDTNVVLALCPL